MSESTTKFDGTLKMAGIAMAVLGAILLVVGTQFNVSGPEFWRSYFFGWFFWMGVTLGMLGLTLLHHIVKAKWSAPLVRLWEAGSSPISLGLIAVLFVPVLLMGGPHLYEWLRPEAAADKVIQAKSAYLNQGFWIARFVIYFAIFIGWSHFFATWLRKEETTGDQKWSKMRGYFCGIAMLTFVLALNFAMTDWGMSLDPHWFSTIYGIWHLIGFALAGISFSVAIFALNGDKAPYSKIINKALTTDIGHIMLMLTMFWAYFSLSQYLITWSGNLPEFTAYYIARRDNGFAGLGTVNMILSFFLPFVLLLAPSIKRNPKALGGVAAMIFLCRIIDLQYIIGPSIRHDKPNIIPAIGDFGGLLLVGGLWMIAYAFQVAKKPLLTEAQPYESMSKKESTVHA